MLGIFWVQGFRIRVVAFRLRFVFFLGLTAQVISGWMQASLVDIAPNGICKGPLFKVG